MCGLSSSADKVLVDLIRLSRFAFLPFAPERRGQIEGHDHLLGGVTGDVIVVPEDLYDASDLLSVGIGSAFEVFVFKVLSDLHFAGCTSVYIYILDICLYDVVFGFNKKYENKHLV